MLEKILSELNKRGVYVDVKTRYSARFECLQHTAEVNTGQWPHPPSVPTFSFKVFGQSFDELAKEIENKLPMVEPIIAAMEEDLKRAKAARERRKADDLIISIGPETRQRFAEELERQKDAVEPNLDPKTARERPIA